jgi:acyl carrier protein
MNRQDALQMLAQTLDLGPKTLTGEETLSDLPGWDSLSTLTFISVVDREVGLPLRGDQVTRCQTVGDLLDLIKARAA